MSQKSEKAIQFFLKKSCLIVVMNKSTRQVLKKNLVQMGIRADSIITSESFEAAKSYILDQAPALIFCSYEFDKHKAKELLELHFEVRPSRKDSFFYIISERDDSSIAPAIAEMDIEGFLGQPITLEKMQKVVGESFEKKISLTPYLEKILQGKELYYQKKYAEARLILDDSKNIEESPVEACYYEGLTYFQEENFQDAHDQFEEGDAHAEGDYACIVKMFDSLLKQNKEQEAFELLNRIKAYPLNPYRVPLYAKICLQVNQLNSAVEIIQKFDEINFDSPEIKSRLAEVLLTLSQLYQQEGIKSGCAQSLDLAFKYSGFNPKVLSQVLSGYLEMGEGEKVKKILDSQMSQSPSFELKVLKLKLEAEGAELSPMEVLSEAMELKNQGKSFDIYKLLISSAKAVGKKKDFIEDLVHEAIKEFPEEQKILKSYLM